MYFQDPLATLNVGPVQDDTPIKTARTQQCRIRDVRPVRCSNDDYVCVSSKAIHLDQDLVEGLLSLIMRTTQSRTAMASHGVDLVHKDDARRIAFGLFEEIPNPSRADSHEHLYEL